MSLTDYRYRKLRTAIKTSGVGRAVKEVLFCALRDYKKEESDPEKGTFGDQTNDYTYGKGRCLVGAALHNVGIDNALSDVIDTYSWEEAAKQTFGVTSRQASAIINGFDAGGPSELNKNSRVQKIAHRLRVELLGTDEE